MKTVHWRHSRRGKSYWWALEMRGQLDPLRRYLVLLRICRGQAAPERGLHKTKKRDLVNDYFGEEKPAHSSHCLHPIRHRLLIKHSALL